MSELLRLRRRILPATQLVMLGTVRIRFSERHGPCLIGHRQSRGVLGHAQAVETGQFDALLTGAGRHAAADLETPETEGKAGSLLRAAYDSHPDPTEDGNSMFGIPR